MQDLLEGLLREPLLEPAAESGGVADVSGFAAQVWHHPNAALLQADRLHASQFWHLHFEQLIWQNYCQMQAGCRSVASLEGSQLLSHGKQRVW